MWLASLPQILTILFKCHLPADNVSTVLETNTLTCAFASLVTFLHGTNPHLPFFIFYCLFVISRPLQKSKRTGVSPVLYIDLGLLHPQQHLVQIGTQKKKKKEKKGTQIFVEHEIHMAVVF